MGRFPETSQSPKPSGVSLQLRSTRPERHALHNLSGEGRRGPRTQTAAGPGSLLPASPAPGKPRPGESREAAGKRASRSGGAAGPDARPAAGRSPAQDGALAGTGQCRSTRLGVGCASSCSLEGRRTPRRPPPGVFIQTPVAGKAEAAEAAEAAAADPARIPGNVSAAPRPPHARGQRASARWAAGGAERACARAVWASAGGRAGYARA